MSTNFAIIGGDLRSVKLLKILAYEKNTIYIYGLENSKESDIRYGNLENYKKNIISCTSINDKNLDNAQVVIGPIPFSKDGVNIYAPYAEKEIKIDQVIQKIKNKILIAGSIPKDIYDKAKNKNIKVIDIMQDEKLAILNCISTAEGAIEIAIRETDSIIHGSNTLILGFGRIGKVLSKKLQGLSCKVTCAARKKEDFAWIKAYGYNLININEMGKNLSKYDIIFNTVPKLILNNERLEHIRPECLLIDLASSPGGIDKEAANSKNIKVINALALPGKVAPLTTARFIKEAIYENLEK